MLKRIMITSLVGTTLLGFCVIAPTSFAEDVLSGETGVTSTVNPGDLAISATDPLAFTAVSITGAEQTPTASTTVTVTDLKGTFAGWNVQVKYKAGTDEFTAAGITLDLNELGDISTSNLNFHSQNAAVSPDTYEVIQELNVNGTLTIPDDVRTGEYGATLEWTLANTPAT